MNELFPVSEIKIKISMIVGVGQFELWMSQNQSLKEKRQILRKLKEKFFFQFKIGLTETDYHDLWQRAKIGFALVGNNEKTLDSVITRAFNFIVSMNLGEVNHENRDFIHYE